MIADAGIDCKNKWVKYAAYEGALKEEDRILNVFDKLDTAKQGQLDEMSESSDLSYHSKQN